LGKGGSVGTVKNNGDHMGLYFPICDERLKECRSAKLNILIVNHTEGIGLSDQIVSVDDNMN
jgi:hypothetical protein